MTRGACVALAVQTARAFARFGARHLQRLLCQVAVNAGAMGVRVVAGGVPGPPALAGTEVLLRRSAVSWLFSARRGVSFRFLSACPGPPLALPRTLKSPALSLSLFSSLA
jgi:hypothetical protein